MLKMMKRTHLSIATAITIPIILKSNLSPTVVIGVIGAVAPDWDFYIGIQHRTLTHSLLATIITTSVISLFNAQVGLIWGLSYLSHLISDSFTKMGVPFLYPFIKTRQGFKLIYSGGGEDYFVQLIFIYLSMQYFI